MITAKDIAREVGVSISTVGRAMTGDPRISEETRARVQLAAERAGYTGSQPARIVRGATSNIIGLLIPEVRNYFFAQVAQALSLACDAAGYRLVLSLTDDDAEVEARQVRELASARAAGIIIVPTNSLTSATARILRSLPHVQLLRKVASLEQVIFGIDDSAAIRSAVGHLLDLGHESIGYIGGHTKNSTGAARLAEFQRAAAELNISPDRVKVALGPPSQAFGAAALLDWSEAGGPTAIISGSVNITTGIVDQIERSGIAVPADVSLVGFGDADWFRWWRGGLTTIRPPIAELATSCGLWLLHQIRRETHPDSSHLPHSMMVTSSLQLRRSTAAPLQKPSAARKKVSARAR